MVLAAPSELRMPSTWPRLLGALWAKTPENHERTAAPRDCAWHADPLFLDSCRCFPDRNPTGARCAPRMGTGARIGSGVRALLVHSAQCPPAAVRQAQWVTLE